MFDPDSKAWAPPLLLHVNSALTTLAWLFLFTNISASNLLLTFDLPSTGADVDCKSTPLLCNFTSDCSFIYDRTWPPLSGNHGQTGPLLTCTWLPSIIFPGHSTATLTCLLMVSVLLLFVTCGDGLILQAQYKNLLIEAEMMELRTRVSLVSLHSFSSVTLLSPPTQLSLWLKI